MDIHRCRFVPYEPQSIDALAFSHPSNSKQKTPKDLKLALGRQNGDIEIWNPTRGEWVQERVFRGGASRTIDSLQWTQDITLPEEDVDEEPFPVGHATPRLFSSGGTKSITEWNVDTGVPKSHVESNAGDIWCFAAQPQWMNRQARQSLTEARASTSQLLAAGCADGSIVLFSTADNELRFERILSRPPSKKSRCTSITWRDRNTVIAGYEESVLRVFDVRTRQILRTLHLGKGREGDKPVVWAVKCLPNGTLLSGDSLGELKIWDASNFSQSQRIKAHAADILDIATNSSGTMILTCGVDRRTVAYAPQSNAGSARTQRWHEIRHRRFHEHDVKSMATFESTHLSIAISGGIDTVPVVLPLKNWNEEYHRSLPHLPQKPQMSVSSSARILFTWWSNTLYLWHLSHRLESADPSSLQQEPLGNEKLLACVQLDGEEHITSANISPDGSLLIAATNAGVHLFQLRRAQSASGQNIIRYRQLQLPKVVAQQAATMVGFSPDSKWLYAIRLNCVISVLKIMPPQMAKAEPVVMQQVIKLDRKRRPSTIATQPQFHSYSKNINSVAFSSDSRILAVGDLSGNIDTWILQGHESDEPSRPERASSESSADSDSDDSEDETDSRVIQGQKWVRTPAGSHLPSLDSAIIALSFKPSSEPADHPSHISGNEGLHVTRHNHHPISPENPPPEAGFLVAVTANHQIVMFDTMGCRLADWSRRNSSSQLPQSFKIIKDRVMGTWFDTRPDENIDRLWLYGANFIYMLDLSRDLASMRQRGKQLVKIGQLGNHALEVAPGHALARTDEQRPTKKRKINTGAGDMMHKSQRYSSKLHNRDEAGDVEMSVPSPPQSDEDDDSAEDDEMDDTPETSSDSEDAVVVKNDQPGNWSTFQYRAIFGACALPQPGSSETPEVVIVERPTYDFILPPRFAENKDW